ncbi:hypothetical protein DM01DRAFT_1339139 [Hesseltinella vesiculosa]|uniref:Uncharacterized protein n=1 Tax=Hesseltinella vesiculosa TaxID=101127 RepID=A0A1X2G875_9FUNG|nr:hypothetical protein DM01DRAFT_1339139 [Hesseltinella vesiculosa]
MPPLNALLQVTDQVPIARCSDCKCKRPPVHFEGRRCRYSTCIRCRNSAARQRSPPSEAMINWDVLDEFYGQFRHNPALPIKVHLPDNLVDLLVGDICASFHCFMFYFKLIHGPSRRSAIAFLRFLRKLKRVLTTSSR